MNNKFSVLSKCICIKELKNYFTYNNVNGDIVDYNANVGDIFNYTVFYDSYTVYIINDFIFGEYRFEEYFMNLKNYRKIKLNKILNGR